MIERQMGRQTKKEEKRRGDLNRSFLREREREKTITNLPKQNCTNSTYKHTRNKQEFGANFCHLKQNLGSFLIPSIGADSKYSPVLIRCASMIISTYP